MYKYMYLSVCVCPEMAIDIKKSPRRKQTDREGFIDS